MALVKQTSGPFMLPFSGCFDRCRLLQVDGFQSRHEISVVVDSLAWWDAGNLRCCRFCHHSTESWGKVRLVLLLRCQFSPILKPTVILTILAYRTPLTTRYPFHFAGPWCCACSRWLNIVRICNVLQHQQPVFSKAGLEILLSLLRSALGRNYINIHNWVWICIIYDLQLISIIAFLGQLQ